MNVLRFDLKRRLVSIVPPGRDAKKRISPRTEVRGYYLWGPAGTFQHYRIEKSDQSLREDRFFSNAIPAIYCGATIIQSLRDQSTEFIERFGPIDSYIRCVYNDPRIAARWRFISATRKLCSFPRRMTTLVARISMSVSAASREIVGVYTSVFSRVSTSRTTVQ
jgi:hypothetical protein